MTPLFQQIVDSLLADFRDGRVQTGERLPSENELSRLFGVSRITAKKALDELAHAGFVERVRGKGTFALSSGGDSDQAPAKDHLIGFLLPDFSETFGLQLLYAVEARCQEVGAHLIVKRTFGSAERETQAIQALLRLNVGGLIIFPVHGEHYSPELLRLVLKGFPVTLVDRYLRGIPACSVFTDNREAAAVLSAHVLAAGCRNVAFASPPVQHTSTIEDRLLGFETALARRGRVPEGLLTLHSSLPTRFKAENIEADEARIEAFLLEHPHVDAFIASEYNLAVVLAHALVASGRRVPEDIAVACFDAPSQPLDDVLFSHIQQDEGAMGSLAVELLLRQLGGERLTGAYPLAFELLRGRSTKRNGPCDNVTRREVVSLHASLGAHLG